MTFDVGFEGKIRINDVAGVSGEAARDEALRRLRELFPDCKIDRVWFQASANQLERKP
jgi:hypothetical protein